MTTFVLRGSVDELKSSKALALLAACVYGNVSLTRSEDNATNTTGIDVSTPPCTVSTSSLSLKMQGVTTCYVSSTNAGLRWIAGTVPTSNLLGEAPSEQAVVDSWLSFAWSSIDLPMEVLLRSSSGVNDTAGTTNTFFDSLRQLDSNLTFTTYLAGGKGLTIADIRILVSLWLAATSKLWDPEISELNDDNNSTIELGNLKRWYQTLVHQEWFISSVGMLPNITASTLTSASRSLESAPAVKGIVGVELNGSPTPVVNRMYRRNRIRIKELLGSDEGVSYIGQTVSIAGWSRTIRKASSKLIFIEINDGSVGESIQCVLVTETEGFEECKNSGGTGSSFSFTGQVVASVGGDQKIDIKVTNATLLGAVYGGNPEGTVVGGMLYPLSKKEHTLEFLRDIAHLRPRGRIHAAAMRIRHAMAYATHTFFHNHGFLYVHTPILTGADCEGAGEQFGVTTMLGSDHLKPDITIPVHKAPEPPTTTETDGDGSEQPKVSKSEMKRLAKQKLKGTKVDAGPIPGTGPVEPETVIGAIDYGHDFFCQRMNLTVSGQLNVETHACALSDVYTFGPTFRAEESRTYRHLAEFWMIEPEIAFATLKEDIDLAEDYLKYCVQFALEHCSSDLEFFENNPHGEKGLRERLKNVLENEFKRVTYTEAIEILQKAVAEDGVKFEVQPVWGIDLPSEHERYICEKVFKMPTVLTDYPKEIKAFYMKLNDDEKTVAAADILVPKIGEIIGGSQREHRYEVLKKRCVEMNVDPSAVWWYLDLRRYGTVPHAGFGLGFERLILFITGLDNIRDVIPFPRWVGNAKF